MIILGLSVSLCAGASSLLVLTGNNCGGVGQSTNEVAGEFSDCGVVCRTSYLLPSADCRSGAATEKLPEIIVCMETNCGFSARTHTHTHTAETLFLSELKLDRKS